jgi:hypothetical protein
MTGRQRLRDDLIALVGRDLAYHRAQLALETQKCADARYDSGDYRDAQHMKGYHAGAISVLENLLDDLRAIV